MSRIYDIWEKLVGAVLKREEFRRLAFCPSSASASCSSASVSSGSSAEGSTSNSGLLVASGSDEASPSLMGQMLRQPNLSIFSFSELKAATRNFKSDTVLGEGGFGIVYKGWLNEKSSGRLGSGTVVAIRKLNSETLKGFQDWQSCHAKISDFGLAKMSPTVSKSYVTSQIIATYGYAAPEYVATGHLCVKSDVYGFGVVLAEMLTGLRALDTSRPSGQHCLVDWIKPHLSDKRKLKTIMDSRLEGRYPSRFALQIAQLALNCLEGEPKNRPSMHDIAETLERIDSANEIPRKPSVRSSHQTDSQHGQQLLRYRSLLHPRQEGSGAYPLPPRT